MEVFASSFPFRDFFLNPLDNSQRASAPLHAQTHTLFESLQALYLGLCRTGEMSIAQALVIEGHSKTRASLSSLIKNFLHSFS